MQRYIAHLKDGSTRPKAFCGEWREAAAADARTSCGRPPPRKDARFCRPAYYRKGGCIIMSQNAIVSLRGISVDFDDERVLHSIDLDIMDKEFITFLGPSGCRAALPSLAPGARADCSIGVSPFAGCGSRLHWRKERAEANGGENTRVSMGDIRTFQRHSNEYHIVIPAKETVSYRFITFELARRLSTRCPRASWLIAKSNHRQARRSLQDAYVDQRRLCVIPSLWLPIPFLRWLEWRL